MAEPCAHVPLLVEETVRRYFEKLATLAATETSRARTELARLDRQERTLPATHDADRISEQLLAEDEARIRREHIAMGELVAHDLIRDTARPAAAPHEGRASGGQSGALGRRRAAEGHPGPLPGLVPRQGPERENPRPLLGRGFGRATNGGGYRDRISEGQRLSEKPAYGHNRECEECA